MENQVKEPLNKLNLSPWTWRAAPKGAEVAGWRLCEAAADYFWKAVVTGGGSWIQGEAKCQFYIQLRREKKSMWGSIGQSTSCQFPGTEKI